MMRKKLISIFFCMMLVITNVVLIIPNYIEVKATPGGEGGDEESIFLNNSYIRTITESLSEIVKDASIYPPGTLAKGRDYGSDGEHFAATNILIPQMINLDLYSPPELDPPFLQQIDNTPSGFDQHAPTLNLTNDIEIQDFAITIHDLENETDIAVSEFYIRPMWNWRFIAVVVEKLTDYGKRQFIENILKILLSQHEDYIFNSSRLTKNISYDNLSLIDIPKNTTWFNEVLFNCSDEIMNNESVVDYSSFMNYFLQLFQEEHNFTFGELNASNAGEKLYWFNSQWKTQKIGDDENFLFIGEDPTFNINATDIYPCTKALLEWLDDHPIFNKKFRSYVLEARLQLELLLMNKSMPTCKGLLLYDDHNDVYNMGYQAFTALPILQINGTTGRMLNASKENYTISFYLDQKWNENIESYNVIGQINGTNPDETIIIDCLYDGWWNQATADSAVGIGIMLGIAKYFKDNNIIPKCNIKFIGFAGEEHGLRGAYYYEATNNDTITTIIDLNQLGIAQTYPRLTLNIIFNNESINSIISAISNDTDYVQRTSNTSDFKTMNTTSWAPLSDYTPFKDNESIKTICVIEEAKEKSWYYHHRDGMDHTDGDSMKNIDWNYVNVTAELIWNITKYYTVNPDCWLSDLTYEVFDSSNDGDTLNDSIRADFKVYTILPYDKVGVNLSYAVSWPGYDSSWIEMNGEEHIVTSDGKNLSFVFSIPDNYNDVNFSIRLRLYNSTGLINEIVGIGSDNCNFTSSSSDTYHLYHPLGYITAGGLTQNVEDRVTGVAFTANEDASANNITVYLSAQDGFPPVLGKCMIYRSSDLALIGTTGEISVTTGGIPQWKVFTFYGDPQPPLVQGVEYTIVCWTNGACSVYYDESSYSKGRYNETAYGSSPSSPVFTNEDRLYSMYCAYTPD